MINTMNLDRYVRQMRYPPLGEAGQRRLADARVLLCGCGALGSVIAKLFIALGHRLLAARFQFCTGRRITMIKLMSRRLAQLKT